MQEQEEFEPLVIAFCCNWCSYTGADLAGVARLQYPTNCKQQIQLEACISQVVDENCDGCAYCVHPCPYDAITLIEYMKNGAAKKTVESDLAKCHGCGVCQATCPNKGIFIRNFRLEQISEMIDAALGVG